MSTHHHHLSTDPSHFTLSPPVSSSHCEPINGQAPVSAISKTYPPPTAQYDEVAQSPDLFWDKLKSFHKSFGTKFAIPTVGGRALDLHRLFVEVTSRGGLEKIIRERKWKEVIVVFNFPSTITSASFVLRKFYQSLLYHFEQVYYFHKESPPFSLPDSSGRNLINGSSTLEGAEIVQGPRLQLGCTVLGTIDAKFDNGYTVTVNLGSSQLKGVLYHTPPILHMPPTQRSEVPAVVPTRRRRKRSRLALRDPSRPKSNRSGYNFFFAEHYNKLRPQYHGQERAISKRIGSLWNNLTEAEKEVYQEKGVKDKERYKTEMLEYRTGNDSKA